MTRATILAVLLVASTAPGLLADCHKFVVAVPNDPTLTERLMGLIGPATHVVAFVGIVKGNVRLAAVAEGAAFVKETYDYINKLSPQERQNLEVCNAPPPSLNTTLGPNKPILIGTKNDLDGLFSAAPSRLAPIQNDFTNLGRQLALQPLARNDAAPVRLHSIFGNVSGVVKGDDGLPMAGVVVWLLEEDGSSSDHATTDWSGAYAFVPLPGKYVLAAYNPGYLGWSTHIETRAGASNSWEIRLKR